MWVAKCKCGNYAKIRIPGSQSCEECAKIKHRRSYAGLKFGKLTATDERKIINKKTYIKCVCDCGNETWVSTGNLTSGQVKSCGCLSHIFMPTTKKDKKYLGNTESLVGLTFNDLIVKSYAYTLNGNRYWNCQCKCGNEK